MAEVASFLVSSVDYSHKLHETLVLSHQVIMVDSRSHSHSVLCKLHTGAQVSILPLKQFQQMSLPPLQPSNVKLHAFGNHIVKPLGKSKVKCLTLQDNIVELVFFVTEVISVPLLSAHACLTLGLLQTIEACNVVMPLTLDCIFRNFADVFRGLGVYAKEYHIQLQEGTVGVIRSPRKIPYAVQPRLKEVLAELTRNGIIADVDCPTEWVNNLVLVQKKDKSIHICLDPRPLNRAILREMHASPTPSDVQVQLSSKLVFAVIDMQSAFWHVRLSDSSSYLTAFHTPWGRKRFLRMPFGLSSASEIMQKHNEEIFGDISGVHVIADDLIISAENPQEHDHIMRLVLTRTREKGVRFNKD